MFTIDEFSVIGFGDLIEVGPLFKGLDPLEQVKLACSTENPEATTKVFGVTYQGVSLGVWKAVAKEGKVTWQVA